MAERTNQGRNRRAKRRTNPPTDSGGGDLLNLGKVSRGWLDAVGIRGRRDLGRVGAAGAFRRVEAAGFRPSVNLLYAMHAALLDLHWTMLPPKVREDLKRQAGR